MIQYGAFSKRIQAFLIDVALLLPLALLNIWSWYESSQAAMVSALLLSLITPTYLILFHAICGQSVGKMVVGLRVEKLNGAPLTWRAAFVRFSPAVVFCIASGVGAAVAIHPLPDGALTLATYTQKARMIRTNKPPWVHWCGYLNLVWLLAEVLVLQASTQKRAIHDLLAGTVVTYRGAGRFVVGERAG